jgi:hypothetical protein
VNRGKTLWIEQPYIFAKIVKQMEPTFAFRMELPKYTSLGTYQYAPSRFGLEGYEFAKLFSHRIPN